MSRVARAVIVRLVILGVVGAALYGLSQVTISSEPKHFRIDRADIDIAVNPDASLHVTERLTFDFSGDFTGAYRDVPLAAGVRARNVSVSEGRQRYEPGGNTVLGSYDRPGTFGAEQIRLANAEGDGPTAGFRVVWHYSASSEERTFQVEYDVTGAAVAHDDVVDVPWVVWGDQWEFWLDDLDARIALTGSDAEPVDGWLRPAKLGADPDRAPGALSVSAERLPSGEQAILRAAFPRDAFRSVAGARVEPGDGLEAIRAEESEASDEGAAEAFASFAGANIVLLEVLWTLIVVGVAMALYLRGQEADASVPTHLPEPPEEIPPALAFALAREGAFDDRLVLATLLDLVDRGFYDAKPAEGGELDLTLAVPAERPNMMGLTDYEVKTIEFFDGLLEEGPGELGKLKDRVPQHSASWRNRWETLTEELDRAEEGQLRWERDLTGARRLLALVALAGYVVIGLAYWNRMHLVAIPIFATLAGMLFIYLLPATWLRRLDPASRERHARWSAFERWTDDFPRLQDDPPATLKLWRRILVYAVAFGTAERVIASGRIPEPVVAEAAAANVWTAAHFAGMSSGVTPSFNGFASAFASQVAPQPSSSGGGGGGFSGGGGGFSGGGGGGAW